jgi:hypothetical protein
VHVAAHELRLAVATKWCNLVLPSQLTPKVQHLHTVDRVHGIHIKTLCSALMCMLWTLLYARVALLVLVAKVTQCFDVYAVDPTVCT